MRANHRWAASLVAMLFVAITGCESDTYDPIQAQTLNPEPPGKQAAGQGKSVTFVGQPLPKRKPGEPAELIYVMFRAGQYNFELPTREDPQELMKKVIQPNGAKWKEGNSELEVANGKITYNGKDYGTVQNGDIIKVWESGALSVNGGERLPVDGSEGQ